MSTATTPALGDDDIRAFGASATPHAPGNPDATPPKKARRRLWPWWVLGAMLLAVVGALVLAVNLVDAIGHGSDGWHVSVDDDVIFDGVGSSFGAALAIAITAIVLLCVGVFLSLFLPFVLALVLGVVALGIGLPLLLVIVLLAVLLSPLWLPVALLVWWLA